MKLKHMAIVNFIVQNSRQILLIDFTNIGSTVDLIRLADEAKKFVALHQPRSLLVLIDFTGMKINKERTLVIKAMAAHNRPYIRFIALVGLGSLRSIIVRLMLLISGKSNHRVFGNKMGALDWLSKK
jgi:hypothetical protein